MMLMDTVLTMPGTTIEKEYPGRIAAINADIAFCDAEKVRRTNVSGKRCTAVTPLSTALAKRQKSSPEDESRGRSSVSDPVSLHLIPR